MVQVSRASQDSVVDTVRSHAAASPTLLEGKRSHLNSLPSLGTCSSERASVLGFVTARRRATGLSPWQGSLHTALGCTCPNQSLALPGTAALASTIHVAVKMAL